LEREATGTLQLTATGAVSLLKQTSKGGLYNWNFFFVMPAIAMMSSSHSLWFAAALSPLTRRTERR
jgi:hypothetical protein